MNAAIRMTAKTGGWAPELQKARVYEQILVDIITGDLPPGARLDEQALVQRYSAGLAGVRDALGRLALQDLVIRRPRAGTTVAPLDLVEIKQSFEARALIEPYCASLAATHGGPEDHAAIKAAFEGAEQCSKAQDPRALVLMDHRFHCAVAWASHNATLARMITDLHHKAARYWVYSMTLASDADRQADLALHREVSEAIFRHDAPAAENAMRKVLGVFPDQPLPEEVAPAQESRSGAQAKASMARR